MCVLFHLFSQLGPACSLNMHAHALELLTLESNWKTISCSTFMSGTGQGRSPAFSFLFSLACSLPPCFMSPSWLISLMELCLKLLLQLKDYSLPQNLTLPRSSSWNSKQQSVNNKLPKNITKTHIFPVGQ